MSARSAEVASAEADLGARTALLSSLAWLAMASLVGVAAAARAVLPELGLPAWLRPVAEMLTVLGFLTSAGFAAVFAILPRVLRVRLHNEVLATASVIWWNLLLAVGAVAMALGHTSSGLGSLAPAVSAGLVLTIAAVGYNVLVTVSHRRERKLYASAWFLIAAVLWLLVVFVVGNLTFVTATSGQVLASFGSEALFTMWLLPVALGAAFYVVPQATGNPLHSQQLAVIAFWSLVLVGVWAGLRGSPVGWLAVAGAGMSFALLVPVLSATSDLFATARGRWGFIADDIGLRWTATGLVLAVVWVGARAGMGFPPVAKLVGTSLASSGLFTLGAWGAFSALAFGFLLHMYPRLIGRAWWSRRLSNFHFWATLTSAISGATVLGVAGLLQATAGADAPGLFELGIVAGLAVAVGAVAQFALIANVYKTSRSGDPLHLVIQQAAGAAV